MLTKLVFIKFVLYLQSVLSSFYYMLISNREIWMYLEQNNIDAPPINETRKIFPNPWQLYAADGLFRPFKPRPRTSGQAFWYTTENGTLPLLFFLQFNLSFKRFLSLHHQQNLCQTPGWSFSINIPLYLIFCWAIQ